ncbi:hypothetical protein HanRHA438_Chr02g0086031 [Helianthus annuus]|uniref:Uncharacterized protein n=1 Tax=Helianthus annuus TaxID=4232 RepID=A0A9K3JQL8_HELAN|nr:hypothetical protein HanXRQr2_Chr02g0074581 [Helianthus annuus]KAJ0605365.1 hypothetical protein HanHA300_Chr02g0062231 [Helianthus annuus]KAJ0619384.1 hypothetical protein HanHA89_Chr02g0070771 [Helianthus annuus]KAJ0940673.1 hypothetical protein HanRHA438_Chr02g0086031 [Helianthus annuus]
MVPPNGMTKWKTKFFYVKAAAIAAKLQFRNVTGTIITENFSIPKADTVDWFPNQRIIGWVKLGNKQLWVLRMMLGNMSRKAWPVVWEKNGEDAPLWRMFCPDFKGEVAVVACEDGEERFNRTIRDNFWLPERDALEVVLRKAKGILGPWETLLQRVFPNSPCRSLVISSFVSRRNRTSRLLFLLWCQRWQVSLVLVFPNSTITW